MTVEPGDGLFHRDPGALDAAQEVTARGVAEALERHPDLWVAGATEVAGPSRALIEAGDEAALVVLGSRGYGRVVGALLGSVAFAVAPRAACPVIVVKDEAPERPAGPEHRIVVGTDGSEPASVAVEYAAHRALGTGAELEVVTCTGGHLVPHLDEQELRAAATAIVENAAAGLRDSHPGLPVSTRVEDCPAEETLVAAGGEAGMVVVGTRGRGAFEGVLLGSVSHAVIHGATSAVAVVGDRV
jgi:nucleotide-binding universal stress UspA family protein